MFAASFQRKFRCSNNVIVLYFDKSILQRNNLVALLLYPAEYRAVASQLCKLLFYLSSNSTSRSKTRISNIKTLEIIHMIFQLVEINNALFLVNNPFRHINSSIVMYHLTSFFSSSSSYSSFLLPISTTRENGFSRTSSFTSSFPVPPDAPNTKHVLFSCRKLLRSSAMFLVE